MKSSINLSEELFKNFKSITENYLEKKNTLLPFEEFYKKTTDYLEFSNFSSDDILKSRNWYQNRYELSFLKEYFQRTCWTELIIHSNKLIQIHDENHLQDLTEEDYQKSLEYMAYQKSVQWNYKTPFASFKANLFGTDVRVTLIHKSCNPNEISKAYIRRLNTNVLPLDSFKIDQDLQGFLTDLISSKKNIMISGATASGKTSLLNSLISFCDENEHIVILEDTHELITKSKRTTYLLSEEESGKSLLDYCAYAMRLSPDRIILGELRSSEIRPFLLAMNTGHKGLLSSIHANSAVDCIDRMNLLFQIYSKGTTISYEIINSLICENLDYIIHLEKKEVVEIIKIIGSEGITPYYERIYSKIDSCIDKMDF